MISSMKTAAVMAAIMIGTSVPASAAKPTRMLADTRQQQRIEPLIPLQFGTWRAVPVTGGIVNPQVEDFVNKVYAETVSKIYENDRGERVILTGDFNVGETSRSYAILRDSGILSDTYDTAEIRYAETADR